jgi:hypothetical protein
MKRLSLILLILVFALQLAAEEGMIPITGMTPAVFQRMQQLGFQLKPEDIWDGRGNGLALAVVNLGATGSFVSENGLILTNHHVAFGAVQRQATPDHNYIRDGFLADSPAGEIQAPGYTAKVMTGFENVTTRFKEAFRKGLSPKQRYETVQRISRKLVTAGEKGKGVECQVSTFYGGREFYRITSYRIKDIRIVYVPPRSIGEYGGEIDNWMWPRHTGDFSFLRAYVGRDGFPADFSKDNVPFKPRRFLKIAHTPLKEGDFTMIMGYPGRTSRWYCAAAVGNEVLYNYPRRIRLLKEWIAVLEQASTASEAVRIKNAGQLKGLYNSLKNSEGMLESLLRIKLHEQKLREETDLSRFIDSRTDMKASYGGLIEDMNRYHHDLENLTATTSVLQWMLRGSRLLQWAVTINKWSIEKARKDADREPGYQSRDIETKKVGMSIAQSSLDIPTDKSVFSYFLKQILKLPASAGMDVLRREIAAAEGGTDDEKIVRFADRMFASSRLADPGIRLKMMDMSGKAIAAEKDAFVDLARNMQKDLDRLTEAGRILSGRALLLEPLYVEAVMRMKKNAITYPDANSTFRFSYGRVEGYSPRDAVEYKSFTTLKGVIEKNSGQFPFRLDPRLVDVYGKKEYSSYIDRELRDVPVNFITSNDSTGGNSGSPVLNGRGELVGILFDGNYEALSSDFQYDPAITRSIHVDIRYVLFISDKVSRAVAVLKELGVQ